MRFPPFPLFGQPAAPPTPVPPGNSGSLRRFTMQQFAQTTGIVATRMDRALSDLIQRYNNLQPDDLARRYVTRQVVGGYSPMYGKTGQDPMPFLSIVNDSGTALLTKGVQNKYRLKGTFNNATDPLTQLAWTTALYFPRPARIVGVHLNMLSLPTWNYPDNENGYRNPFMYGTPPPPPYAANDYLKDMYIDVSVDSKWYKGNARKLQESEVQKRNFTADAQWFSPQVLSAPMEFNMFPAYPEDEAYGVNFGVCIDARNINIPIPEQSTMRLSILVPVYENENVGTSPVDSGWNHTPDFVAGANSFMPWANNTWSWAVTVQEALV